ncbi:pentapeptide repeat-containing protein [Cronbergia sp. UHCC 0137]|uniref:pentapeptide repeat-containing protein n=1 Tax=Cronbergia sp. UHCC 0137 TaxID=3110239 RepID=UPI002B1F6146|nr:pentapeptide repeat-containing protein [Cronbergia sp. UHCC 0137]MEA5616900.1 pentapeptide repeat-containing protein [Cronbergia sp. UHCC 0137]
MYQSIKTEIINNIIFLSDKMLAAKNNLSSWIKYCYLRNLPNLYCNILIGRLEAQKLNTNLADIEDLAFIAKTHPKYQWRIINMLTNVIRNNSPYPLSEEVNSNPTANNKVIIQAMMTLIANRDTNQDPEDVQIDLSHTDLSGINLQGANLKQTNLYHSNLSGANLHHANLEGVILTAANLNGANLNLANLSEAILSASNLDHANLVGANLQRANLYLASLHSAILDDSNLDRANLRESSR